MSNSERDASPVRKTATPTATRPTKTNIHAVVKLTELDDIYLIKIKAAEISDEEYAIIMAWTESPCISEDYLREIDEDGVYTQLNDPYSDAWATTPGLTLVPKTRDEYFLQQRIWSNFFEFDLDDSVQKLRSKKPSVTINLRF